MADREFFEKQRYKRNPLETDPGTDQIFSWYRLILDKSESH